MPASVTVPAGQGFAGFTITTSPVAADTSVTIRGTYGVIWSATITVLGGSSDAGFMSPGANAPDSGGDGQGFEGGAANAHGVDAASAVDTNSGTASSTSCTSAARDKHRFFNYGIALPAGTTIHGIEIRLDARVDSTSGSPRMCVDLSWDGGVSWTAAQATPTLTTTMTTRTLGGPSNTWGRSWTAAELSNANFRVRVPNVANSTARDFSLDWIAVRISHQSGASGPDTTPPTASITGPATGATVSGTTTISANASDNVGVTRVEFLVDGVLQSSDTTSPYSASWNTTTAMNGSHSLTVRAFDAANNQTTSGAVSVTVGNGAAPVLEIALSGVPATIRRGQVFTATGTVTNTGGSNANGYSVVISFTPGDSIRLQNPQTATQSVATVAAGGSQSVSWQIRADRASSATLTMTLRHSGGATVRTVSQTIAITN